MFLFRIITVPYNFGAINETHACSGLMSGEIDFVATYYFLLIDRLPKVSIIAEIHGLK